MSLKAAGDYKILLIIKQYVYTQSTSESEAINKIIRDILSRSEQKNAEPIQFTWTNRYKAVTDNFKEIRDTKQRSKEPEQIRSENEKYKASSIIKPSESYISTKHELDSDDPHIKLRKANHSYKSKTHFRNQMTTPTRIFEVGNSYKDGEVSTLATEKTLQTPLHNDNLYITRTGGDSHGRIFSGPLFDTTPMETARHASTTAMKTTNTFSTFTTHSNPFQSTTTPIEDQYEIGKEDDNLEDTDSINITGNKLSVIKAIEDLLNSMPSDNHVDVNTNSNENIIKEIPIGNERGITNAQRVYYSTPENYEGSHYFQILNNMPSKLTTEMNDMITFAATVTMPTPQVQAQNSVTDLDTNSLSDSTKSYSTFSNTKSVPSSLNLKTTNNVSPTDLYLLVDQRNKKLKGYFTLKSRIDKTTTEPLNENNVMTVTNAVESHLEPLHEKEPSNFINGTMQLNKELHELYNKINAYKADTNSAEKAKKTNNWDKIKKFFGHDRVCRCKCKANRTTCAVCTASDRVMRELTFEFDNLAQYMKDHCMEIQTYFWMNPTGGKKLRDSVHKLDKSLHDYYKRVKGKCTGRTCKTFSTYLDKRHLNSQRAQHFSASFSVT